MLVCNGHLTEPNKPKIPGLEKFKGRVLHTHDYKDFRGFEDKRVLVVGIGNSAADVACELSRHASHVSKISVPFDRETFCKQERHKCCYFKLAQGLSYIRNIIWTKLLETFINLILFETFIK